MTDQAASAVADHGWSLVKRLADFTPWARNSQTLRFNVTVDGVRRDARVTRDCLKENRPVDWEVGRKVFAEDPDARRLRVIAQDILRQSSEALITARDWKLPTTRTFSR